MWEHALRQDNLQGFVDYLRFHPYGKHAEEARRRYFEQSHRGKDMPSLPEPKERDA
jgi:hypothetical protein